MSAEDSLTREATWTRLRQQLEQGVASGQFGMAGQLLDSHPELASDHDFALELIYLEYTLLEQSGAVPPLERFCAEYSQWEDRLRRILMIHAAMGGGLDLPAGHETPRNWDDTLATFPLDPAGVDSASGVRAPEGYQVFAELGRGAMGIVYRARQEKLDRSVALKMIRAPLVGREERIRFRQEAEAAAAIKHPGIVGIYDVGVVGEWPYLAMELVTGGSLADQLRDNPLPPEKVARLMQQVAEAVDAAHRHGVVHRDLKPANILLEEDGTPRLTDFGLAKRLWRDGESGEVGTLTQSNQMIGTPCYMAPEQASGQSRRVGPTADVYAIGAILYEALTGVTPFRGAAPLELIEQILYAEPIAIRRLRPKVPRDLETIALKCLQKRPDRRYDSAAAVAADLGLQLAGRPIQARPVTPLERGWRWCARKPLVATLVAALLLVTAVAFATVLGLWRRSENLRLAAESNEREAVQSLAQATESQRLARKTVDDYIVNVSKDLKLQDDDLRPLRRRLLEQAVPFYEDLIKAYPDQAELRQERADALLRFGVITREIDDEEHSRELIEAAVAGYEELVKTDPENAAYVRGLAKCLREACNVYDATGKTQQANAAAGRAIEILLRRSAAAPRDESALYELARAYNDRSATHLSRDGFAAAESDLVAAAEIYDQLIRLAPENSGYRSELILTKNNLSGIYGQSDRPDEAEKLLNESLELQQQCIELGDSDAKTAYNLGVTQSSLAIVYAYQGRFAEFDTTMRAAIETLGRAARENPSVPRYQDYLASMQYNFAHVLLQQGMSDEAERQLLLARPISERLVREHPTNIEYRRILGMMCIKLASIYDDTRRTGDALQTYQAAIAQHEQMVSIEPRRLAAQQALYQSWFGWISVLYRERRFDELETPLLEVIERLEPLVEEYEQNFTLRDLQARFRHLIGHTYTQQGQPDLGRELLLRARAECEAVTAVFPDETSIRRTLAATCQSLGRLENDHGDPVQAIDHFTQAIEIYQADPALSANLSQLANYYADRGIAYYKLGSHAEAAAEYASAIERCSGGQQDFYRARHAVSVARNGDHRQAAQAVGELAVVDKVAPGTLFHLATAMSDCVSACHDDSSIAEDERTTLAAAYTVRSVDLLSRAHAGEYFTARRVDNMIASDRFAAIRESPEFLQAVAEIRRDLESHNPPE